MNFLSHGFYLIVSLILFGATLLWNLMYAVGTSIPAFFYVAAKSENGEFDIFAFISNPYGLTVILLVIPIVGLPFAFNFLLPSKFLPQSVNTIFAIPLFIIGSLCCLASIGLFITGLFISMGFGILYLGLPTLLCSFICLAYSVAQFQPNK